MELSTGTLVFLGIVALAIAALCIRRPRLGIAFAILLFIPAPIWPSEENTVFLYGFGAFTMLVLLGWLLKLSFGSAPFQAVTKSDDIARSLKLWLLLCLCGLPLSLIFNSGSLGDRLLFYGKGLIPFVYLLVFFVVRALPFGVRQAEQVLNCVLAVAIAYAVITFAIYAVTGARVTWIWAPLTFPFPVLGANVTFARMLLSRSRRAIFGWALLTGVLGIAALLTFTKGQIIALIVSLMLIAFLISRHRVQRIASRMVAFVAAIAICATALAAFASDETRGDLSFSDLVASRMNDESSTEGRLSEWQAALQQFVESPIVGKGIGYQLERDAMGEMVTAGYVHNQVAYVLMTMGIAGLIVYLMLIYNWVTLVRRFQRVATDLVGPLAAVHGCMLTLGVYALMFVTFRTIQHNLLLGIFLALTVQMTAIPQAQPGGGHEAL